MKVVGNCGNEQVVKALQELCKEFCSSYIVSKVYLSLADIQNGIFHIGEIQYGDCCSVKEVIDKVNSNKGNIVKEWDSMKKDFPESNHPGYWFLSSDVADCTVHGTDILTSESAISMKAVIQGDIKCLKQIMNLVEMDKEAEGYYCYDSETDTLYNHSDYSDMVGEQVAVACGIEL